MDYKKLVSEHENVADDIKKLIPKDGDPVIRVKAADIKKAFGIGEEESFIDVYYGLRKELFDKGIVVGSAQHKSGDMVLEFRERMEYDSRPLDKEEETREKEAYYKELEGDVVGLSEIAKMEGFNEFDPERIVKVIRENKECFERVRMTGDDRIGVVLREGIGEKNVAKVMLSLGRLDADTVETDNGEVELWWD